jgi:RimJ/RimL family protein N-acetyltransferase
VQISSLSGQYVELEPMQEAHVTGLLEAALEDRTNFQFTTVPTTMDSMLEYVKIALADAEANWSVPFVVVRQIDQRIVGTTRYLDLDYWAKGLGRPQYPVPQAGRTYPVVGEIGSTWYCTSAQRTAVNTECKLLLLTLGFEIWNLERVSLKTDARNQRSREAIERLGASFEGVRRAHVPAVDGTIRDSAYFSIVRAEWPTVKSNLRDRLERSNPS